MADEKWLAERFAELEARLTFSDELLDALNRTVFRQQQVIDRLQQELRAVQEILAGAEAAEQQGPRDEIPPHY
jgi:SlyX protein